MLFLNKAFEKLKKKLKPELNQFLKVLEACVRLSDYVQRLQFRLRGNFSRLRAPCFPQLRLSVREQS